MISISLEILIKLPDFLWNYNKIKQQRLLWHKPCVLLSLAAYGSKVTSWSHQEYVAWVVVIIHTSLDREINLITHIDFTLWRPQNPFSHSAQWFSLWDVYRYQPIWHSSCSSTAIYGSYIICDLIVWENTNGVHFSCDMGKYSTCPMDKVFA